MPQVDFCPECGTRFDEGAATCRNCGAVRPDAVATELIETPPPPDATALEALTAELAEALTPKLLLLRPLGQGGMGTVFLARDPALKRLVVVKVLSPELAHHEQACRRFEREAEAAAAVAHPNVVGVFQVGRLPRSGTSYFVMQYVDGRTLADVFPLGAVVPVARARRIVGEVAAALAAAHARGLVHRDIKPANLMLERESDRTVVLDFGISAAISPERRASAGTKLTQMGTSIGTPQYMSPEQAAAEEVTDRSDVYSLGVVAYELLAGQALFAETTPMALAAAHINKTPAPIAAMRPDVDAPFAQLVDQCLAKSPTARPTAEQVARALGAGTGRLIEWPPPGLDALHGLGTRMTKALTVAIAVGLFFFALLVQPPTIGSPVWAGGERSGLWFTVGGGCCESEQIGGAVPRWDPTPSWQFLLVLLVIAEGALAAFALAQAYRVATLLLRARRSGYPLIVCLDVAFDGHPDTGSLVNGGGSFAALAESVRLRVRRWRRWRAAIAAATPVLTLVLAIAWLFLARDGGAHAGRAVSAPVFAVLLLPLAGGLLAYAVLAALEGSAVPRARLTWRQQLARRQRPLVLGDVAGGWLREAGATGAGEGARGRWFVVGGYGALGVLLAAFVLAMALLAYVAMSASMTVVLHRRGTGQWQAVRRPWNAAPWQAVDSAVRSLGLLPAATEPDSEAAAMVARLLVVGSDTGAGAQPLWHGQARAAPIAAPPGYRVLDTLPDTEGGPWWPRWSVFVRLIHHPADTLPRTARRRIDGNLASPAYGTWKRLARATPPRPLWFYASDFGGLTAGTVLGHYAELKGLWDLVQTAQFELLLAARNGDRQGARAVAGELLAAGLTLGRSPVPASLSLAGYHVVGDGLATARELARSDGDAALWARADSVLQLWRRVARWGVRGLNTGSLLEGGTEAFAPLLLVADPRSRSTAAALSGMNPDNAASSRTPLDAVDRWALIASVVPAFCTSPREVLLGIDPARATALEAALDKQGDVPRADEWIRANLRWYQQVRVDPAHADVVRDPWSRPYQLPWFLRPLGWVGLGAMRGRIAFCQQMVWTY